MYSCVLFDHMHTQAGRVKNQSTPIQEQVHQYEYLSSALKSGWFVPSLQSPLLFSSLSFHRRKVIWHSKVICKGDWWPTIDVPIPSRQRHFIQLCWVYKHERRQQWRDYQHHKGEEEGAEEDKRWGWNGQKEIDGDKPGLRKTWWYQRWEIWILFRGRNK